MQDGDFHFIFPYLNNKQMIFLFLILFLFFLFCFSFSLYMENYKVQLHDRFLSDDFFLFYGRNVISSVLNIYIYIYMSYILCNATRYTFTNTTNSVLYIYIYICIFICIYITNHKRILSVLLIMLQVQTYAN